MLSKVLCVFLMMTATAFGQVEAIIKGPESVNIGDLVILNASDSVGANHKWVADTRVTGKFFEVPNQKMLFFAFGTPGEYKFQLIVTDTQANIDQTVHYVTILPSLSPPEIVPDVPQPPRDINDFSQKVTTWAKEVNDTDGAQALALVYRQSAESITDGTLNVSNALATVRVASDGALRISSNTEGWNAVRERISQEATLRTQKGILGSARQMAQFFAEITNGLEMSAAGSTTLEFGKILAITVETTNAIKAK
jgi:hypothetical protein